MTLREQSRLLNATQLLFTKTSVESKHLTAVLSSNKVSFLENFCDMNTFECTRCPAGWQEHGSRCFSLSQHTATWRRARRECQHMATDLAVIQNAQDQEFLNTLTGNFYHNSPEQGFKGAWVGLEDLIREGKFVWVSGPNLNPKKTFWRPNEPDNIVDPEDQYNKGEDCVVIAPPDETTQGDPLNTWRDIDCMEHHHFLCETPVFIIP